MSSTLDRSITVQARTDALADLQCFIDDALQAADFSGHKTMHISLASEEAFVNICQHAGVGTVDIDIQADDSCVQLTFTDAGASFNPLDHAAPDITLNAADREPGGLGIHLVRTFADDVSYARIDNRNTLRLTFRRKE